MEQEALSQALKVQNNLIFEAEPSIFFYAALILGVIFLAWHFFRLRRIHSPALRFSLTMLRLVLLFSVLLLLLKPTILRQSLAGVKPTLSVLIDTSRSMSLPYDEEIRRIDAVKEVIGTLARHGHLQGYEPEFHVFSEGIEPLALEDIEGIKAGGRRSAILKAMDDIQKRQSSPASSKMLVFTDGGHDPDGKRSPARGEWILIGVGGREKFKDIRLKELKMADIGFRKKAFTISTTVEGSGYEEREASLSLKVDGQVVSVKKIALPAEGEEEEVEFQWTPEEPGVYRVAVEVQPHSDEKVVDNNLIENLVTVVRDRLRVLFIAGTPSWNYRFLREALKSDPTLDLISFVILRSPYDIVDVPQNELALIPFPTKKLFTEELSSFDLIILDNFSLRPYLPGQYLERLKDYIEEGGALWVHGGPLSFINGGYRKTPIEELLPFGLEGSSPQEGYVEQEFRMAFTEEAFSSPFFNFEKTLAEGRESLKDLPLLSGFNIVGPSKKEATVLANHPYQAAGEKPQPIIAMRPYGRGRVLAVATDYLWVWNFVAAGEGLGNRLYLEFVKNAVRWLTGDPLMAPVQLTLSSDHSAAGKAVKIKVRTLDEHYRPIGNAALDLNVFSPWGEKVNLQATPSEEEGVYETDYIVPDSGNYRFAVEAAGPGGVLGKAMALLQATGFDEETATPGLDEKFLVELAARTGGRYLPYRREGEFIDDLAEELQQHGGKWRLLGEERIGLGSFPLTFALFLIVLSVDWSVRKRYHLE